MYSFKSWQTIRLLTVFYVRKIPNKTVQEEFQRFMFIKIVAKITFVTIICKDRQIINYL